MRRTGRITRTAHGEPPVAAVPWRHARPASSPPVRRPRGAGVRGVTDPVVTGTADAAGRAGYRTREPTVGISPADALSITLLLAKAT